MLRFIRRPSRQTGIEEDSRTWVRHVADLRVNCQPAGILETVRLPASVCDVSPVGLGLVLNYAFEPGTLLMVDLAGLSLLARVVRTTGCDGEWVMGCLFAGELDDARLQAFGAEQTRSAPADKRTWVRFPCRARASYHGAGDTFGLKGDAEVENISVRGAGLVMRESPEVGAILHVDFEEPALTMLACVLHVKPQADGRCAVGCGFIRQLGEPEFQALLRATRPAGELAEPACIA